jgi:hypothetical protein
MKKLFPFFALFLLLLCWLQGYQVRDYIAQRLGNDTSSRIDLALRQGKLERANALLFKLDAWYLYKNDGFYYQTLPPALAGLLGDSMIAITDTLKAKRFIAAVDKWPWLLRRLSIWRIGVHSRDLVGNRSWYELGINHVFQSPRYFKPEYAENERRYWRTEEWWRIMENIALVNQINLVLSHSSGIGIVLLLIIVAQWMLVSHNPLLGQSYMGFKFTAGGLWRSIAFYALWIIAYVFFGIFLQWLIFTDNPLLSRFYAIQVTDWYYRAGAFISFTIFLFLVVMVQVRTGFHDMAQCNEPMADIKPVVLWFTILEQYKQILWRLWSVWIIILAYGFLLARHS